MKKFVGAIVIMCGALFSGISLADGITLPEISNPLPQTATSTDEGKLSLGASMGSVDGVSMLYRYEPGAALQGVVSIDDGKNHVSVDRLFLKSDVLRTPYAVPYFGVGVYHKEEGRMESVGLRAPIGVMLNMPDSPIQMALEMTPTLELNPEAGTGVEKTLSVRYAF